MRLCIAHGGDMGEPSGGTDRVSALARGLSDRGIDVTLVIPEPSDALPSRLEPIDIECVDTPVSNAIVRASSVVKEADRVARNRNAKLQLEHSSLAGVGTLHGVDEFVLDMHDLAFSRFDHVGGVATPVLRRGVKWIEARALSRAQHIIVVSRTMFDWLNEAWNVPEDRMTVVPNGFFPETIPDVADAPTVSGRVTFLGTLHPKVDVESLVAVGRLPDVSDLVVIGDGAQRDRVERASTSVDALRTTGRLPDEEAFELLASSEVLLNPQTISPIQRASSPVKLFYYAALGKPMVVTSGPSIVEHLVKRGAAVTAYSASGFLTGVRTVLENEEFARALGQNAKSVSNDFHWSNRIDDVERLYADIGSVDPVR